MNSVISQIKLNFINKNFKEVLSLIECENLHQVDLRPEIIYMYSYSLYNSNKERDAYIFLKQMSKKGLLNDQTNSLFMWIIYNYIIVNKEFEFSTQQIATKFITQKTVQNNDTPFEEAVMVHVKELFSQDNKDFQNILNWVDKLDGKLFKVRTVIGNEEYTKSLFDWYFIRIKALVELKEYSSCLIVIEEYYADLANLHYKNDDNMDNDLKYIKALCLYNLNELDKSYKLLIKISIKKPNIKIYLLLLEITLRYKKFRNAKIYAVKILVSPEVCLEERNYALSKMIEILYEEKNYLESFSHLLLLKEKNQKLSEEFLSDLDEYNGELLSEGDLKKYWLSLLEIENYTQIPTSYDNPQLEYERLKIFDTNSEQSCLNCLNYTVEGKCAANGFILTNINHHCYKYYAIQILYGGGFSPK